MTGRRKPARQRGVTLVEMIMFIVIMAVVIGGLMAGFTASLGTAPHSKLATEALELAKERMELIRAQRKRRGFYGFNATTYDLCALGSVHPACAETDIQHCFYTGTSTCAFGNATQCFGGNTDYKCVRVRALDPDGSPLAEVEHAFGRF